MRRKPLLQVLAIVLSLGAAFVSYKLLVMHLLKTSGSSWFDAGCKLGGEDGAADCGAVLASRYAYIPPLPPAREGATVDATGHLPSACAGLIYFSLLALWFLGVGRPDRARRWFHLVPLGLIAFGILASLYYLSVMFFELDEWCPWCVVGHVLNFAIAACAILLWPRAAAAFEEEKRVVHTPPVAGGGRNPAERIAPQRDPGPSTQGYPSWRLVLVTFLAMGVLGFAELQLVASVENAKKAWTNKQSFDQCMTALNRLKGQPEHLVRLWQTGKPVDVEIRPDDPMRTHASPAASTWDLVIFSDFECPSCKMTAAFLDEQVQPLFDGRLRIIFKHFPLEPECNPLVANPIHKHACEALRLAEATRLLGGNDAFWKAHDLLFARQQLGRGLPQIDPSSFARELGQQPGPFLAAVSSQETARRLAQDIEQAKRSGLSATPWIILNGRHVDGIAAKQIGFWDKLADVFWPSIGEPRPESTRLRGEPTQDSQGLSASP